MKASDVQSGPSTATICRSSGSSRVGVNWPAGDMRKRMAYYTLIAGLLLN